MLFQAIKKKDSLPEKLVTLFRIFLTFCTETVGFLISHEGGIVRKTVNFNITQKITYCAFLKLRIC